MPSVGSAPSITNLLRRIKPEHPMRLNIVSETCVLTTSNDTLCPPS